MIDPSTITLHEVYDWAAGIVLVSSLVYSFLPPWEWFAKWPNFQSVYQIITMTIARWGSLNLKPVLYPQIAVSNQVDKAVSGPVPTVPGNQP